ncbi:MAG: HAD family hydrolase [Lachnospiraceae bacterium]|nr:HAD family hydrolase [Lachnospiraceae bacterium]
MITDGIIFDVDGTLWDSTDCVATTWKNVIEKMNMKACIDVTAESLKSYFGKTMEVIADEIFPDETRERRIELMDRCCEEENEDLLALDENLLYDGVRETVIELSKKVKVFIVSNCQKGYIEILLEKYDLNDYVTDIECYGNNGNGKAENIELLVKRNNLKKPVYVGDTDGDKKACDEVGVPFIFATYGFGETEGYVAKIDSIKELLNIDNM